MTVGTGEYSGTIHYPVFNFLGITLVGAALGVVLGLAVAQISGEYCIHLRDWDLCNLDNARAMISGGLIGGAAGLLWSWRSY